MVDNLMDVIINFLGLVRLAPKVSSGRLGWCINKKGGLKLRLLRQKIPNQELVLHAQRIGTWMSNVMMIQYFVGA